LRNSFANDFASRVPASASAPATLVLFFFFAAPVPAAAFFFGFAVPVAPSSAVALLNSPTQQQKTIHQQPVRLVDEERQLTKKRVVNRTTFKPLKYMSSQTGVSARESLHQTGESLTSPAWRRVLLAHTFARGDTKVTFKTSQQQ
jgi:hypothetical protein